MEKKEEKEEGGKWNDENEEEGCDNNEIPLVFIYPIGRKHKYP